MFRRASWAFALCLALAAGCAFIPPPEPTHVKIEAVPRDAKTDEIARGVIEQVSRAKRLELASGEPSFILTISDVSPIAIARGDGYPNGRDPLDADPNLEVNASIRTGDDRVIGMLSVLCAASRISECARAIVRELERTLAEL